MKGYRKTDVEFHRIGYGSRVVPAVNVKVYGSMTDLDLRAAALDAGEDPSRVAAWWYGLSEDDADRELAWAWEAACETGWELLQDYAVELFGPGSKVYSEGRQGGWAYVQGIYGTDVESWDAVDLNCWALFERFAKAEARDIPRRMAELIVLNSYASTDAVEVRKLNGPSNPALIGATA